MNIFNRGVNFMCIKLRIPSITRQKTLRPVCFSFVLLKAIGIVETSFLTSHSINHSTTSPRFNHLLALNSHIQFPNRIKNSRMQTKHTTSTARVKDHFKTRRLTQQAEVPTNK